MTVPKRMLAAVVRAVVVLLPLVVLLACGWWFYHAERNSAKVRAERQLEAVALLKANQLADWRATRLRDALLLTENPVVREEAVRLLSAPDQGRTETLSRLLRPIQQQGVCADLLLVDGDGRIRLGGRGDERRERGAALAAAFHREQPVLVEVPADPAVPEPRIELVVPLFSAERPPRFPVGAAVMVYEGAQGVSSMLRFRVTPTPTMEALLVRRSGEGGGPPAAIPGSLAATALAGHVGVVEGPDDRGIASLAAIAPVPDSDWVVIVREEAAEIFGVWRFRAALLMLAFAVLTVGGGGLGLFAWQYRQKAYYKALYETEARLRHSLERHRITLQAIGDGIIVTDGSGRIELFNAMAEALTGWTHETACGRALTEVFPTVAGTTLPAREEQVPFVPEGGGLVEGYSQVLLRTRNGAERAVMVSIASMFDTRGAAIGAVLIFRDQMEERRMHRLVGTRLHLREYAETHSLDEFLIKALHETALLVTSPLVFLQTAEPERRTLAIRRLPTPKETAAGHTGSWAAFEDISGPDGHWPDILHHERPVIREQPAPSRAANGGTRRFGTVRDVLAPVLRNNRVVAVLGAADKQEPFTEKDADIIVQIAEDIWRLAEQKTVEEALLASERRYRTLYRSMMDAFVVTDLRGNLRECNDAYGAMLGYSVDELKRMNVRDITPGQWLAFEKEHIRKQLMHEGCSSLYEKEYRRRDGTVFPVELRTFLIVNNEGIPEGMSAVVRDITERRAAEEERDRLREQLNQSQKMESVGQLAGGVAHDFNNMLSVILGYAELASRKVGQADPVYASLREIVSAARRSAEITRQLLAFARKQTIAPKMLDLNGTMGGMLKMLQRLIGENIELQWLPGKDLWPVLMDPSQVDQLLANLCVNARDAMKNRGGKITIETGTVTFDAAYCAERAGFIPGDFVLLAVSDTGCGIEKDILDKIFEPFFTTKGMGEGTGLGLATVYGIVRQNNGFVNVYSEPGEGTTFRLYLPRAEGSAARDDETAPPDVHLAGRNETVLVVEDDETILTLNRNILEYLGYAVLAATSPRQALQLARWHARDIRLLITDVIMPEMNGRELAREIQFFCPSVKVLFVSGYTANVIAHRHVLDEGVSFLAKPFSTEDLAAKIREVLDAKG